MKDVTICKACWISRSICRYLYVALFCSLAVSSYAVPAFPDSVDVRQPDGTRLRIRMQGDEHFSWHETEAGYAIVKGNDGIWRYARPSTREARFDSIPDGVVGIADPVLLKLKKHGLPSRAALKERVAASRRAMGLATPTESRFATRDARLSAPSTPEVAPPPSQIPVSGTATIRNIVILASFSDHWDAANSRVLPAQGRVSTTEYSNLFNERNHAADGAVGSVADYYQEVSYGKLNVQSVVTPWVKLPKTEAYYGTDGTNRDTNWLQMIVDAINAADSAGFDFSQGDSDHDGWVDCLTVIHSGHGQDWTGNESTSIWSKQGEMANIITKDGVKMLRCSTEPALRGLPTSTAIIRIGVICHEMGHFLGLPDLYDYSDYTLGIGRWGIMGYGSWNGDDGKRPAHFCAWSKCMLGFARPVEIHSQGTVSLPRVEDNSVVHMIRDGMSEGEYFLLENRAKIGFDNDPKLHAGIVIYHVNAKSGNNDFASWTHPLVKLEEADGNDSLGFGIYYSQPGDVWTASNALPTGFRDQTGYPQTNAMRYQEADYYNRTDVPSSYSHIALGAFSDPGPVMTYSATTLKPTVSSKAVAGPEFTVDWAACADATKYEVQQGTAVTLTSFADGAESEDAMCENWHVASAQRSNGGAKTGSYSYAMQRYYGDRWYPSVQSITMKTPFKLTPDTALSFALMSHLDTSNGYLKCQVSNDGGNTWLALGTYSGYIDPWLQKTIPYSTFASVGVQAGDLCIIRFIANFERAWGWSPYPGYGYAIDDISITGTEIAAIGNWVTISNTVTFPPYGVSGTPDGSYFYRVQAFANGSWRGFGPPGTVSFTNATSAQGWMAYR